MSFKCIYSMRDCYVYSLILRICTTFISFTADTVTRGICIFRLFSTRYEYFRRNEHTHSSMQKEKFQEVNICEVLKICDHSIQGRCRALGHFSFSNFCKLHAEIWKNKNNCVWKFLFRFLLILLRIKNASKKIWLWPKAGSSTPV